MCLPTRLPEIPSATGVPLLVETQATFALTNDPLLASADGLPPAVCHLSTTGGAGTSAARLIVSGNTGGFGGGGGILAAAQTSPFCSVSADGLPLSEVGSC